MDRLVTILIVLSLFWTGTARSEDQAIPPPTSHAHAKSKITVGYALGRGEAQVTKFMLSLLNSSSTDFEAIYLDDTTQSYSESDNRFIDKTLKADLILVFAGQTSQINEVQDLVHAGSILPLTEIPSVARMMHAKRVYRNLLSPVTISGNLYAIPVRVCPPVIATRKIRAVSTVSWSTFATNNATYFLPDEPYYVLCSRLLQSGLPLSSIHLLDQDVLLSLSLVKSTHAIYHKSKRRDWNNADVGIVVANELVNSPRLVREFDFHPFPGSSPVLYGENTWYIGISASVSPSKMEVISEMLAALLSDSFQLEVAKRSFSPPTMESLVSSDDFKTAFPANSPQRIMSNMTGRLQFRMPSENSEEIERYYSIGINGLMLREEIVDEDVFQLMSNYGR